MLDKETEIFLEARNRKFTAIKKAIKRVNESPNSENWKAQNLAFLLEFEKEIYEEIGIEKQVYNYAILN